MNKITMNNMIKRANMLHAQLREAIGEECRNERLKRSSRRRIVVTHVHTDPINSMVSEADVLAAYTALLGDVTTRLTGKTVMATHIQVWLEEQYGTKPDICDVKKAMTEFRKAAGAVAVINR